jgi:hypothetical protein
MDTNEVWIRQIGSVQLRGICDVRATTSGKHWQPWWIKDFSQANRKVQVHGKHEAAGVQETVVKEV